MKFPQEEWDAWVATRPGVIQDLCRRFPPSRIFWLSPPGQVVRVFSYHENGTLTVVVDPEDNPHLLMVVGRHVFGVPPADLHEMDEAPAGVLAMRP